MKISVVLDRDAYGEPKPLRTGQYRFAIRFAEENGDAIAILGCRCDKDCTGFIAPVSITKGGIHNIIHVPPSWQQKILDTVKRLTH